MNLGDAFRGRMPARRHAFRRGDVVRINRGSLVNLTGVIEKLVADDRCAISVEGGARGVLVVVSAAALEMADPLSHLGKVD